MLKVKRVYDPVESSDGWRVLMDRLWPRGLNKEQAHIDGWYRELGPSDELRKWFSHDPSKWEEFRKRYKLELLATEKQRILRDIAAMAENGDLTIVYSSREPTYNNAVVLREVIADLMSRKPRFAMVT